jgi:glutamate-1-semialdehyde 2,1-aminomutase
VEDQSPNRITEKSESIAKAAARLLTPWGRPAFCAYEKLGLVPLTPAKGKGAVLTDVDGQSYVDYELGCGALVLGHADERVEAAVVKAAAKGLDFARAGETEIRLAELIASRVSRVETVCLLAGAGEALAAAAELARAVTGKQVVVEFVDTHLCCDGSISPQGSRCAVTSPPDEIEASGSSIPDMAVIRLPYNDVGAVRDVFAKLGPSVAAVQVEPLATRRGLSVPTAEFVGEIRRQCDEHGSMVIADETATAFRLPGGTVETAEALEADLVCLGGVLGGGLPLVALGGSKELMRHAVSQRRGTRGAEVGMGLAAAAAVATLQALTEVDAYDQLEEAGARLAAGFKKVCEAAEVSASIQQIGSIIEFRPLPPEKNRANEDQASSLGFDGDAYARLLAGLLDRGVLIPASPCECMYLSLAHTTDIIDQTIEAVAEVLAADGSPSEAADPVAANSAQPGVS